MILLLLAGGMSRSGFGTVAATGALTKEVSRYSEGLITPTGGYYEILYIAPDQAGTVSPVGTLMHVLNRSFTGSVAPSAVTVVTAARGLAWQIDMNVGFNLVVSGDAVHHIDEDVLALTPVASRDALLQTDENVRPAAPIPVTSY